jgi:membrane-associated phospholipid phosphatase
MPFDERVAQWLQRPSLHQMASLHTTSTRIEDLALPGGYVAGYALYGLGAVSANEPTLGAGFHTVGAVLIASHVGDAIKALAGRARPSSGADAEHYAFGAGFANASQYSFPSGHTTVAFAAATAISEELRAHNQASVRMIAPMLYTGATLVGLSRMYNDAHWASDVVAGAAVGTFTARFLVREAYAHPGNVFDAVAVHGVMTVDRNGRTLLGWSSGTNSQ